MISNLNLKCRGYFYKYHFAVGFHCYDIEFNFSRNSLLCVVIFVTSIYSSNKISMLF